ncbi:MAG: MFS transporter, partial [Verrucomicrobiae bacterium]
MTAGYFHSLVAPLRVPIFRSLWIATVASNIGTLMHGVGSAWLMTSMTTSPILVGLVPACLFLPALLVGIWGGVLSDLIERRRILIVTQSGMMAGALAIGIFTVLGRMSPGLLLGLTLSLGFFSALNLPAWQSQIQEMVPAGQVAAAVSLSSISFNAARSVGPAAGGLLVAAIGPASVFFINAASFLGTILVLLGWKRPPPRPNKKAVWKSLREGFSFVRRSPVMRAPLVRVSAFAFGASAVWALLPLLAREELKTGPAGYGALLAAFGAGSVAVAGAVPGLRHRHHPDRLIAPAIVVLAGVLVCLGQSRSFPLVLATLFAGGVSWVG